MRRLIENHGLPFAAVAVLALASAGCGDDVADDEPDAAQTEVSPDATAEPTDDAAALFEDRETLVGETVDFSAEITATLPDVGTAVEVGGDVGDPILVVGLDPDAGPFEEGQTVDVSGEVRVFDEEEMLVEYPYDDTGFFWDDPAWDGYEGQVMVLAETLQATDG